MEAAREIASIVVASFIGGPIGLLLVVAAREAWLKRARRRIQRDEAITERSCTCHSAPGAYHAYDCPQYDGGR